MYSSVVDGRRGEEAMVTEVRVTSVSTAEGWGWRGMRNIKESGILLAEVRVSRL